MDCYGMLCLLLLIGTELEEGLRGGGPIRINELGCPLSLFAIPAKELSQLLQDKLLSNRLGALCLAILHHVIANMDILILNAM